MFFALCRMILWKKKKVNHHTMTSWVFKDLVTYFWTATFQHSKFCHIIKNVSYTDIWLRHRSTPLEWILFVHQCFPHLTFHKCSGRDYYFEPQRTCGSFSPSGLPSGIVWGCAEWLGQGSLKTSLLRALDRSRSALSTELPGTIREFWRTDAWL